MKIEKINIVFECDDSVNVDNIISGCINVVKLMTIPDIKITVSRD